MLYAMGFLVLKTHGRAQRTRSQGSLAHKLTAYCLPSKIALATDRLQLDVRFDRFFFGV